MVGEQCGNMSSCPPVELSGNCLNQHLGGVVETPVGCLLLLNTGDGDGIDLVDRKPSTHTHGRDKPVNRLTLATDNVLEEVANTDQIVGFGLERVLQQVVAANLQALGGVGLQESGVYVGRNDMPVRSYLFSEPSGDAAMPRPWDKAAPAGTNSCHAEHLDGARVVERLHQGEALRLGLRFRARRIIGRIRHARSSDRDDGFLKTLTGRNVSEPCLSA